MRIVILCVVFVLSVMITMAECAENTDSSRRRLSDSPLRDVTQKVDDFIENRLVELSIEPVRESDDAEFCRRVWLDLAGVAPPVWQLRSFLADESKGKRDALVDSLLNSSQFANHMANRWNAFLLPADAQNDRQGNAAALHQWLRKQFLVNQPYDHMVGGFLTAGGKGDRGPAIFYTARNLEPVKLASATSRIFMGVQLECAQCHRHPFAEWTQDDFWSFAAFFSQLELSDSGGGAGLMGSAQAIVDRPGREVTFPDSQRVMPPRYPGVQDPPEPDPMNFRRRQLTIWLASRDNPYFAKAAVNRIWAHLFGRGLVDPIDDMDESNPPSHPELLQFLANDFVENRFDLRDMYRKLARTKSYRRTSEINKEQRPPQESYAAMNVKTLTPEQYFDTLTQNVFLQPARSVDASTTNNGRANIAALRTQFLSRMSSAESDATQYPHGVVQALGLMNGPEMFVATHKDQSGLIAALDAPYYSDRQRIETLFLACLSRMPTHDEVERFTDYLLDDSIEASQPSRLSDLVWILLNTSECMVCP